MHDEVQDTLVHIGCRMLQKNDIQNFLSYKSVSLSEFENRIDNNACFLSHKNAVVVTLLSTS